MTLQLVIKTLQVQMSQLNHRSDKKENVQKVDFHQNQRLQGRMYGITLLNLRTTRISVNAIIVIKSLSVQQLVALVA
nr:hypothetical protein Iba_chr02bCG14500 [Ipomoea batatas]